MRTPWTRLRAWAREWARIYLFGCHRGLRGLFEVVDGFRVVSEILLATNKNNWQAIAEMEDLRDPLRRYNMLTFLFLKGTCYRSRVRTFSWTLSRESGESTAKQIKITCESG